MARRGLANRRSCSGGRIVHGEPITGWVRRVTSRRGRTGRLAIWQLAGVTVDEVANEHHDAGGTAKGASGLAIADLRQQSFDGVCLVLDVANFVAGRQSGTYG